VPAYVTLMGSLSTDIIGETCMPWAAYSSRAAEKAIVFSFLLVTYLLPLTLMIFCYSRIVYALRHKVVPFISIITILTNRKC